MKTLYTFIVSCSFVFSLGQVGIGTTVPHASAMLEVNTDALVPKKGFLLPRVALLDNVDVTTVPSPIAGMTVFNTSNSTQINEKTITVYDGIRWHSISNLPEIRTLKIPTEFIIHSTQIQNFNADGSLASVNAGNVEVVKWDSSEISLDNPDDIEFDNNIFTVKKTSFYQFSGSVNFRSDIAGTASSHIVLVLQKSANKVDWTDFYSTSIPVELQVANKTKTIPIPRFIHHLNADESVRIVLYKAGESNLGTDSGIIVNNVGDQTKSFRITTIRQ